MGCSQCDSFIHGFIIPDGDLETVKCPCLDVDALWNTWPTRELTGACAATCCRGGGSAEGGEGAGGGAESVGVAARLCRVQGPGWSVGSSWESRFSIESIQPPWICLKCIVCILNLCREANCPGPTLSLVLSLYQ